MDLNLPERFDVTYTARDDTERQVVIVHRTVLGSMERFVGGLLEHYAGQFPLWLAPEQVRVIPISSDHGDYAGEVQEALRQAGMRSSVDRRNEKTGAKIRDATLDRVPYMVIVGDREITSRTVAVRRRKEGDQGASKLVEFVAALKDEEASRS